MAGSPAQQRVSSERGDTSGRRGRVVRSRATNGTHACSQRRRRAEGVRGASRVCREGTPRAGAPCAGPMSGMAGKMRRAACGFGRDWPDTCRRATSRRATSRRACRACTCRIDLMRLFSVRSCRARATAHLHTRTCTRAPAHARAVQRGCPIGHGGAIGPPGGLGQLTHSFTGRSREIDKIHNARRCTTRQAAFCHDNLLVAQRVSSIEITVHRMVRRVMRRMMRHARVPVTRGCAPRVPVPCLQHGHRPRACASGVVKPRSAPPRRPGYDSIRFPHTFAGALP